MTRTWRSERHQPAAAPTARITARWPASTPAGSPRCRRPLQRVLVQDHQHLGLPGGVGRAVAMEQPLSVAIEHGEAVGKRGVTSHRKARQRASSITSLPRSATPRRHHAEIQLAAHPALRRGRTCGIALHLGGTDDRWRGCKRRACSQCQHQRSGKRYPWHLRRRWPPWLGIARRPGKPASIRSGPLT